MSLLEGFLAGSFSSVLHPSHAAEEQCHFAGWLAQMCLFRVIQEVSGVCNLVFYEKEHPGSLQDIWSVRERLACSTKQTFGMKMIKSEL